jgi:uncharacterized delta-60 repeat protein
MTRNLIDSVVVEMRDSEGNAMKRPKLSLSPFIWFGLLLGAVLVIGLPRVSATGDHLDRTFSTDGMVTTDFSDYEDIAYDVAIQPDGKIIVVGSSYDLSISERGFGVARYLTNGGLDNTFSGDGKVFTSVGDGNQSVATAVALQADGKIVVAGYSYVGTGNRFAILRYTAAGVVDTTFSGGIVTTPFTLGSGGTSRADALAIQPDGNIAVAGLVQGSVNSQIVDDWAIARYTPAGVLDPTFSGDGKVTIDFNLDLVTTQEYWLNSSDGAFVAVGFGANNDIPAPADFDRDGKADLTVFRPSDGNWYRLNSSNGAFVAQPFGANGDKPTPSAFRY